MSGSRLQAVPMFPVLSLTAVVSGHPVLEPGTSVTCYITASIGSVWPGWCPGWRLTVIQTCPAGRCWCWCWGWPGDWRLDSSHQLPLPGSGRADAGPARCSERCMDYDGLNKYVDMLQFTLRHYRIILMTYRQLNVHIVVCNHVSPQIQFIGR